ncbi:putative short chain oxidoreductase/dehydrogenase [Aspergillus homomorphus CBS 101889]|uniref:Short chain oxidoreductase/dehydrogenase n=1 Tax=Aspergillus homomorphus (strain CBS 101889) TaxID=1450537 RepID=A0A395I0N8_ASPHC|nr:short chain oxidoreductase/dehydrogenase [Aspergillus homomorphus CBS 101889]RAL13762.1 short chain oxidoreductase/dehydrogenase [Aspergillus homomorphus CBS 101889]
MPKTYLITGASSGLGRSLALAALKAGHTVLATARNPLLAAQHNPQITAQGGIWLPLDVTSPDATAHLRAALGDRAVDVVINNAGYAVLGALEDMTDSEVRAQFETNVFGVVRVLKAVLPLMRARRHGVVVNVSSSAGLDGLAACAGYAGSKFALEGMSESLARELAPFNIRVLLVEPGTLRTNFWSACVEPAAGMNPDYAGPALEMTLRRFRENRLRQAGGGDPGKAAQRVVEVVDGTGLGAGLEGLLRLPLGEDCYRRFEAKVEGLRDTLVQTREIAHSIGVDS